jgi:exopolyphosphatase / guanosine-5'-triphosphate,3'-diphosphate pyrophosphatase
LGAETRVGFQRGLGGRYEPAGVVDIGSNSVRLVIFDGPLRHATALHNEKALCAIGRNMVSTGKLDEAGSEFAIKTLERYRELCSMHNVREIGAVATAAARDASNGKDFIRRAEKALGAPITVLSGEEEAKTAAEGTLAGIPEADGMVADLGGGSLDMVTVKDGKTGPAWTFPFGPLRLMDIGGGNLAKARAAVEKGLSGLDAGKQLKGRALYAVGGIWRALAHVDMENQNYPLQVLHQYTIPAERAAKLCRVIAGQSRKSLERIGAVPKRRLEALPYGALVMQEMIEILGFKEIVISAYGLREGVLHKGLPAAERAKDPLIEFARDAAARDGRMPNSGAHLFRWMQPLFPKETEALRRIREAACHFADIGWRRHPEDRASGSLVRVLRGPFGAASHRERAIMAGAVYCRYAGNGDFPESSGVAELLGPEDAALALKIGLSARLAFGLMGVVGDELNEFALSLSKDAVTLEIPAARKALLSEIATKRLDTLADALGRKGNPAIV